jgi:hypothetical protein
MQFHVLQPVQDKQRVLDAAQLSQRDRRKERERVQLNVLAARSG